MVNGQWHLYISPHFFVAMGHPTSHLSYGMNLSSYLTTHHFSYFFPFPQGHSNGFRTATLKGPRIGWTRWTKHWKSETSSLMGKKHMKKQWWFQSSIVSSNPILGGLSDYIPLYHIISALVLILDVIPSMLLVKSPFITILQLVYQPLVG